MKQRYYPGGDYCSGVRQTAPAPAPAPETLVPISVVVQMVARRNHHIEGLYTIIEFMAVELERVRAERAEAQHAIDDLTPEPGPCWQ